MNYLIYAVSILSGIAIYLAIDNYELRQMIKIQAKDIKQLTKKVNGK